MELRLARRAVVANRRGGFGPPLAEGRALTSQELDVLRALWKYDGNIDVVSLAVEARIICSSHEYTTRAKRKLAPTLASLHASGLIAFRKDKEGEIEVVLTKRGIAALTAADPELSRKLDELTSIYNRIQALPISKLEKRLLFASFAEERQNADYRLRVAAIAAERRALFQAYPVVYIGALHDVEHALHFPASHFILVDRRYEQHDLDHIADKLAYYGGCRTDVLPGEPGTVVLSHAAETKIFELVRAEGLAFMQERGEAMAALIAKGVTALLYQAKQNEELQQMLIRPIAPGGLLWEAEKADCLARPAGMELVAEGELAVWRFSSEDFENVPAILLQKPFDRAAR
ncbi:MAG: hypothetical protein QXG98_05430 [Candidatus Micrarchaeia archaeon]